MRITRTRATGTGLLGLGYGLAENTPGLPVVIPSDEGDTGDLSMAGEEI